MDSLLKNEIEYRFPSRADHPAPSEERTVKYFRAFWRFCTAPEFELWWSGFFLSQLLHLLTKYPDNAKTGWGMAYIALVVFAFLYSSVRGFVCARKAGA